MKNGGGPLAAALALLLASAAFAQPPAPTATGTHKYVFAVYNGTEDINHNGAPDDAGQGVLAYDNFNGVNGISAVLYMPGVTTLTPNDLA